MVPGIPNAMDVLSHCQQKAIQGEATPHALPATAVAATCTLGGPVSFVPPFACRYCARRFANPQYLTVHEQLHQRPNPYACRFCPERFRDQITRDHHEGWHLVTHQTCPYCYRWFERSQSLAAHIAAMHPQPRPYYCDFCDKRFEHEHAHQQHEQSHLNPQSNPSGPKPVSAKHAERLTSPASRNGNAMSPCEHDGAIESDGAGEYLPIHRVGRTVAKQLTSRKAVVQRKTRHTKYIDPIDNVSSSKEQSAETESPCSCSFCGKFFRYEVYRLRHEAKEHGNSPESVQCHMCVRSFPRQALLEQHLLHHYSTEPPPACEACCLAAADLDGHRRTDHQESLNCRSCAICQELLVRLIVCSEDHERHAAVLDLDTTTFNACLAAARVKRDRTAKLKRERRRFKNRLYARVSRYRNDGRRRAKDEEGGKFMVLHYLPLLLLTRVQSGRLKYSAIEFFSPDAEIDMDTRSEALSSAVPATNVKSEPCSSAGTAEGRDTLPEILVKLSPSTFVGQGQVDSSGQGSTQETTSLIKGKLLKGSAMAIEEEPSASMLAKEARNAQSRSLTPERPAIDAPRKAEVSEGLHIDD